MLYIVQGLAKRRAPGLVNFVTALAYTFSPTLHAVFTQPGPRLLADPQYIVLSAILERNAVMGDGNPGDQAAGKEGGLHQAGNSSQLKTEKGGSSISSIFGRYFTPTCQTVRVLL